MYQVTCLSKREGGLSAQLDVTMAAEITARASPDGYALMLGLNPALAAGRSLYPKLGFDLLKDFSYISAVATGAQVPRAGAGSNRQHAR